MNLLLHLKKVNLIRILFFKKISFYFILKTLLGLFFRRFKGYNYFNFNLSFSFSHYFFTKKLENDS